MQHSQGCDRRLIDDFERLIRAALHAEQTDQQRNNHEMEGEREHQAPEKNPVSPQTQAHDTIFGEIRPMPSNRPSRAAE